jgi:hypothetical protein
MNEEIPWTMNLRDWLAGHALTGLLTQHESSEAESGLRDLNPCHDIRNGQQRDYLAQTAYRLADAMLAARGVKTK